VTQRTPTTTTVTTIAITVPSPFAGFWHWGLGGGSMVGAVLPITSLRSNGVNVSALLCRLLMRRGIVSVVPEAGVAQGR
jgi:hypothetical protein